jgi:GMP synthase (glutamine-hydrolysing)
LGVCGGHQFLTLAFDGAVGFIDPKLAGSYPERYPKNALAEKGLVSLEVLHKDQILRGVASSSGRFRALQNHYEEVKTLPNCFVNLARSEMSEAQLIRFVGKPVYGVAFHPERGLGPKPDSDMHDGRKILANFLKIVMEQNRPK